MATMMILKQQQQQPQATLPLCNSNTNNSCQIMIPRKNNPLGALLAKTIGIFFQDRADTTFIHLSAANDDDDTCSMGSSASSGDELYPQLEMEEEEDPCAYGPSNDTTSVPEVMLFESKQVQVEPEEVDEVLTEESTEEYEEILSEESAVESVEDISLLDWPNVYEQPMEDDDSSDGSSAEDSWSEMEPESYSLCTTTSGDDDLYYQQEDIVSSSPSLSDKNTVVRFWPTVLVVDIDSHRDYPLETRERLWVSLEEIGDNAERNRYEYNAEGWTFESVLEEDSFIHDVTTGEWIHPETYRRRQEYLQQQLLLQTSVEPAQRVEQSLVIPPYHEHDETYKPKLETIFEESQDVALPTYEEEEEAEISEIERPKLETIQEAPEDDVPTDVQTDDMETTLEDVTDPASDRFETAPAPRGGASRVSFVQLLHEPLSRSKRHGRKRSSTTTVGLGSRKTRNTHTHHRHSKLPHHQAVSQQAASLTRSADS